MRIEVASQALAQSNINQLIDLLINNVDDGASIGWIPPMKPSEAESYWRSRIAEIGAGTRILLFAWEDGRIVGSAQLGLEQRENGNHRGDLVGTVFYYKILS